MSDAQTIEKFLASIKGTEHLYTNRFFGFVAVADGNVLQLLQAKLALGRPSHGSTTVRDIYSSEQVMAGIVPLEEVASSVGSLIDSLRAGQLQVDGKTLVFPLADGNRLPAFIDINPNFPSSAGRRVSTLLLTGKQAHDLIDKRRIDLHLKAAEQPYDSLDELWGTCGLGKLDPSMASVEIIAAHLAEVDQRGQVTGQVARIGIRVPDQTGVERLRLGYRVLSGGNVLKRGSIVGTALKWSPKDSAQCGQAVLDVPAGAVVHCVVSYDGIVQDEWYVGDPDHFQNPRLAAFEAVDPQLTTLTDFLFNADAKDRSRDFEAGVGWLLSLLGFSVLHLSAKRLQDNVDLLATTPSEKVLLVECTTGLMTKEGKLQSLLHRTASMRKRLTSAGRASEIIPVAVISKPDDEAGEELAEASKRGVCLLTRSDLEKALERSKRPPNADLYLHELLEQFRSRHAAQGARDSGVSQFS